MFDRKVTPVSLNKERQQTAVQRATHRSANLVASLDALPFGIRLNVIKAHMLDATDATPAALREFAQIMDRHADELERRT